MAQNKWEQIKNLFAAAGIDGAKNNVGIQQGVHILWDGCSICVAYFNASKSMTIK